MIPWKLNFMLQMWFFEEQIKHLPVTPQQDNSSSSDTPESSQQITSEDEDYRTNYARLNTYIPGVAYSDTGTIASSHVFGGEAPPVIRGKDPAHMSHPSHSSNFSAVKLIYFNKNKSDQKNHTVFPSKKWSLPKITGNFYFINGDFFVKNWKSPVIS